MAKKISKKLQAGIDALEKRFGGAVIQRMSDTETTAETITTGREDLDTALGGGFGKGKVIEIFGQEATGKTGISLDAAAKIQSNGGKVAFIDFEHALNTEYCELCGVDMGELFFAQPDWAEQGFQIIRMLINSGEFDLIIIDSVATMIPKAELEGETGEAKMGLAARTMGQGLRQIIGAASEENCTIIFINQMRKSLAAYGNPDVTPGGNALKFACTQRLKVVNKGRVKEGELVVGFKQHIEVIKNKIAPPYKKS